MTEPRRCPDIHSLYILFTFLRKKKLEKEHLKRAYGRLGFFVPGRTVVGRVKWEIINRFYLVGCFCCLVPGCLQHCDGKCCEVIWARENSVIDQQCLPWHRLREWGRRVIIYGSTSLESNEKGKWNESKWEGKQEYIINPLLAWSTWSLFSFSFHISIFY